MHLGIIKITYNRTATHYINDRFVNLGEEVNLTLFCQSGASESATVCFVISLSICYWLFKCGVFCVVCVCVRERERERESQRSIVCVCVRERERESQRSVVCVCARVCERGRQGHTTASFITVSVTRICSPLELEQLVKLRTLLTVFTFILKAESHDYGKGRYISNVACGVRPITMHCASWPIRADSACQEEGLCRKQCIWERRVIEDLQ